MPRRMGHDRDKDKDRDRDRGRRGASKFSTPRKKTCKFCADAHLKLDFKNAQQVGIFISERGKILPRRYTGACSKHQRDITLAIKRARILAVIPFTATQVL